MGSGTYSVTNSVARSAKIAHKSNAEIFKSRSLNNAMSPYNVLVRESRDSAEHPNSFPIIIALDLTGSMGSIPNFLVKKGLPHIMDQVIQNGEKDPQVLFVGVGDHECDSAPLQIGQFESGDELLEKWLTTVFLEGGGGGNEGESYGLAHYFAGFKTKTDSFEKRGRKGLLFTIGDEPNLQQYPASDLKELCGDGQYETYTAAALLKKARETYDVYHIHVSHQGRDEDTINGWKQLMKSNLIVVDRAEDVAKAIADTVLKHKASGTTTVSTGVAESTASEEVL
jgi:hypothetical protein